MCAKFPLGEIVGLFAARAWTRRSLGCLGQRIIYKFTNPVRKRLQAVPHIVVKGNLRKRV